MPTTPGWYRRSGDGTGITRRWDGANWVGEPLVTPVGPRAFGEARPSAIAATLIQTLNRSALEFRHQPNEDAANGPDAHYDSVSLGDPAPASARQLSSPSQRMTARAIDLVIRGLALVLYSLPALLAGRDGLRALPESASAAQRSTVWDDSFGYQRRYFVVAILALWALDWLLVAFKGATLGKLLIGLQVADAASLHGPPTLVQAALRTSAGLIPLIGVIAPARLSTVVLGLIGIVSIFMLFKDRRHRTVMDRLALTLVLRR